MKFKLFKYTHFSRRDRIITVIVGGIALIILTIVPEESVFNPEIQVCLHHRILGFECPFCGMTRAISAVAHLHFWQAVKYNFVVLPLFILYFLEIVCLFLDNSIFQKIKRYGYLSLSVCFLVIYLYRMFVYFNCL